MLDEPGVRLLCFFFQAEDGIRDFHVTGVQTCALPIYDAEDRLGHSREKITEAARGPRRTPPRAGSGAGAGGRTTGLDSRRHGFRSEERRVGKESRARR